MTVNPVQVRTDWAPVDREIGRATDFSGLDTALDGAEAAIAAGRGQAEAVPPRAGAVTPGPARQAAWLLNADLRQAVAGVRAVTRRLRRAAFRLAVRVRLWRVVRWCLRLVGVGR